MVTTSLVNKSIVIVISLLYSLPIFASRFQDSVFFAEDPNNEAEVIFDESITPIDSQDFLVESDSLGDSFQESEFTSSESDTIADKSVEDSMISESEQEIIATETRPEKKVRFYQKWWFTLLLVLLLSPLAYRYHLDIQDKLNEKIKDLKKKSKDLRSMLKENDLQYEKKELEYQEKFKEDEELKFQAIGLSKFSEIISKNKEDLKKLGQHLIYELVEYTNANSGVIFMLNEEKDILEVLNSYAAEKNKIKETFKNGEGYIGTCFGEGKTIELENVPETYAKIESGLGKALPRYIVFVPLVQDENKLGVIELGSFNKLEKHKVEFIEKLAYNIASALAIQSATEKMQTMLEQSKIQAEELKSSEEELKQNMEEMQTVQEELQRQKDDLAKETTLMNTLLSNANESIYFKDKKNRFIKASNSMAKLFKVKSVEEMYGKSDFDFFTEEHAKPAFKDEMNIIKTGKPIIDKIEKETYADGRIAWVSTSKMPLYDEKHEIIGTFGISKDVTHAIEMENEIKQRNEELQAQEEELRQNLEEMQTVQEDLQRQKEELDKEKALMDAMLNHAKETIYFKDKKSRFIKVSKSMAKLFKVKNVEELYGKSDFDFFTEEHAKPAFDDEMNIIRTGKPIINKLEKETHPDGRVTWVSTSKMPLHDSKGAVIGTFGISKDVTKSIKMETEIKLRNEELLAQEEELRQNLEEMQTIQEDLHKRIAENEKLRIEFEKKEVELKKTIKKLQKN